MHVYMFFCIYKSEWIDNRYIMASRLFSEPSVNCIILEPTSFGSKASFAKRTA